VASDNEQWRENIQNVQIGLHYLIPDSDIEATGYYTPYITRMVESLQRRLGKEPITGQITTQFWND
jgi:hypothetical protein